MSDIPNTVAGPQYEYASLMMMMGVTTANMNDPRYVFAVGVDLEPNDDMVASLNVLGAAGWNVHTTTSMPFGDNQESALVFHVLSRLIG